MNNQATLECSKMYTVRERKIYTLFLTIKKKANDQKKIAEKKIYTFKYE